MGCNVSAHGKYVSHVSVQPDDVDENLHIEVAVTHRGTVVRWLDAVQVSVNDLAMVQGSDWGEQLNKVRVRILNTEKARQEKMVGRVQDVDRRYVRQKMPSFLDPMEERLTQDIGDPFDPKYIPLREEVIRKLKAATTLNNANRLAKELTENNNKCKKFYNNKDGETYNLDLMSEDLYRSTSKTEEGSTKDVTPRRDGDSTTCSTMSTSKSPGKSILKKSGSMPLSKWEKNKENIHETSGEDSTNTEEAMNNRNKQRRLSPETRSSSSYAIIGTTQSQPVDSTRRNNLPLGSSEEEFEKSRKKKKKNGMKDQYVVSYIPNPSQLSEWRAGIEGPPGTPYENAYFCLLIQFEEGYPFNPPKMQFTTPVFHPNVSQRGKICLNMLKQADGEWSALMTVESLCIAVITLLQAPNVSDPLNNFAAKLLEENPIQFERKAREWTNKFCYMRSDSKKRTRFSLSTEVLGGTLDSDPHAALQQDAYGNILSEDEALARVTKQSFADRLGQLNYSGYTRHFSK